jgi:hypothetical protein
MVVPEQRESFVQSIQKAVREFSEWNFEWMMKRPTTGELIWLSANSIPYVDGDEIIFSGIFQDITERKNTQETLLQQAEELRARNVELSRFNRVAVDRELRMVELKRAVNELCVKLGEEPRYRIAETETVPPASTKAKT